MKSLRNHASAYLATPTFRRLVQAAFFGCAAAVLYLSLVPDPPVSVSSWDKGNHVFAFTVLGILGFVAWPSRRRWTSAGLVAYGVAIEVLQSFTPTRQADWHDVVADVVGLLVGAALVAAVTSAMRVRVRTKG